MYYKINKQDIKNLTEILKHKGYNPKWIGNFLIVAESKEDNIYDILSDYNISFTKGY